MSSRCSSISFSTTFPGKQLPAQHSITVNGADIAWSEWGRHGDPLVLLSHATGFHARCWDKVVAHLGDCHVVAFDHRGHGRSSKNPPYDWQQFGEDLVAFVAALDLDDIIGVGHSMGGYCMIRAAAKEPDRFRRVVLFDPVVFDPADYHRKPAWALNEHPVARRRNQWQSPQQMFDAFSKRPPYSRWVPDVLMDYCEHGLLHAREGYELACPPRVEEQIYISSADHDIYEFVEKVTASVTVVRAQWRGAMEAAQDFSLSPTWPALAGYFANGVDLYLPDSSHFMPMEDPSLAARIATGRIEDDS